MRNSEGKRNMFEILTVDGVSSEVCSVLPPGSPLLENVSFPHHLQLCLMLTFFIFLNLTDKKGISRFSFNLHSSLLWKKLNIFLYFEVPLWDFLGALGSILYLWCCRNTLSRWCGGSGPWLCWAGEWALSVWELASFGFGKLIPYFFDYVLPFVLSIVTLELLSFHLFIDFPWDVWVSFIFLVLYFLF